MDVQLSLLLYIVKATYLAKKYFENVMVLYSNTVANLSFGKNELPVLGNYTIHHPVDYWLLKVGIDRCLFERCNNLE